jgi:hypothetical protein
MPIILAVWVADKSREKPRKRWRNLATEIFAKTKIEGNLRHGNMLTPLKKLFSS